MSRYDWIVVQAYYDAGHTRQECMDHFGFSANAWTNAKRRSALRTRNYRLALSQYLIAVKSRKSVKQRLLEEGVLQQRCYECGISHWLGEKLALHLDHINGQRFDHRIDNLRMLCPNCHSQTNTFGWRNTRTRASCCAA